jgi:hypothetical protein
MNCGRRHARTLRACRLFAILFAICLESVWNLKGFSCSPKPDD